MKYKNYRWVIVSLCVTCAVYFWISIVSKRNPDTFLRNLDTSVLSVSDSTLEDIMLAVSSATDSESKIRGIHLLVRFRDANPSISLFLREFLRNPKNADALAVIEEVGWWPELNKNETHRGTDK